MAALRGLFISERANPTELLFLANSQEILRNYIDLDLANNFPEVRLMNPYTAPIAQYLSTLENQQNERLEYDPNLRLKIELDKDDYVYRM